MIPDPSLHSTRGVPLFGRLRVVREENERTAIPRVYVSGVTEKAKHLMWGMGFPNPRVGVDRTFAKGFGDSLHEIFPSGDLHDFETGDRFDAKNISSEYIEGIPTHTFSQAAGFEPQRISVA